MPRRAQSRKKNLERRTLYFVFDDFILSGFFVLYFLFRCYNVFVFGVVVVGFSLKCNISFPPFGFILNQGNI